MTNGGEMTFADNTIVELGDDTDWAIEIDLDPDAGFQSWDFNFQGDATVNGDPRVFQCEVAIAPDFPVFYEHLCRYPGRTSSFEAYDDLFYEMSWRRDSIQYVPSSHNRYRLYRDSGEGIPYHVPVTGETELDSRAFADVFTGWKVDDRDDTEPYQLGEGLDPHPLGDDNPLCTEDAAVIDAEEDKLRWEGDTDDTEDGAEDTDPSVGFERYIYGVSRYRNILGHPYVDDYEGFKDGMEWRYMRQRNDFYGICERGPHVDPWVAPPGYGACQADETLWGRLT